MRSYIPAQADAASLFDANEIEAHTAQAAFGQDLLAGLKRSPRSVPAKYFYDAAGSALFDLICDLPEYYPTRTELKILTDNAAEMAAQIGPDAELIEFGAGSLTKVRLLLDAFEPINAPTRYLPIDISGEHLENAAQRLRTLYPRLSVSPVVADYMQPMALPATASPHGRRVGFFSGFDHRQYGARRSVELFAFDGRIAARGWFIDWCRSGQGAGTTACGVQRRARRDGGV